MPAPADERIVAPCGGRAASMVLPPLRLGSLICSQISAQRLADPRHLDRREVPLGWPGRRAGSKFAGPWHVVQRMPMAPKPSMPRTTTGRWGCRSSPCAGRSPAGWQFMQRALVMTLPASVKSATERGFGSAMARSSVAGLGRCLRAWAARDAEPDAENRSCARDGELYDRCASLQPSPAVARTAD